MATNSNKVGLARLVTGKTAVDINPSAAELDKILYIVVPVVLCLFFLGLLLAVIFLVLNRKRTCARLSFVLSLICTL